MRAFLLLVATAASTALLAPSPSPGGPWPVSLVDVADRAGLRRPSVYGGLTEKRFIIETNGAGVAFVDVDSDGWVDALVLNGTRLKDGAREDAAWPAGEEPTSHLYRNNHDGTFTDITARSGLRGKTGWASSVCVGDYDNDGRLDLFVTYYGRNVLYHNRGDGTFEDVTAKAAFPTTGTRWGSGCSFIDYDSDGKLDLFVSNYLRFDLATAQEPGQGQNCLWKGIPVNCGPKGLPTDTNLLYHNEGGGAFRDVSVASGIARVTGRYPMTRSRGRSGRRRLAGPLRRLRLDRRHPLSQQPRRHVHGRRPGKRRGLQRVRQLAGGHGPRRLGLRRRRPARPPEDALRGRHTGSLPQPGPRPVRGRGRGQRARRAQPLRRVGRRHARPRQRRPAGPLLRDRERLSGNRAAAQGVPAPRAAHRVPKRRWPALRRRDRPNGAGGDHAAFESGRRLRGLRQRRRPRRPHHEHERAPVAAPERRVPCPTAGSRSSSREPARTARAWARRWW